MQIDVQIVAGGVRPNDDFVDQRADAAHRLILRLLVGEAFDELRNGGPITLAHARFDECGFCVDAGQLRLNGVAPLDGGVEIGLDLSRIDRPGADRLNQLIALSHHLGQLLLEGASIGAPLFARRRQAPLIFPAENLEQVWVEQTVAQAEEDHLLKARFRHGEPIGAKPFVLIGRAAEVLPCIFRVGPAADTALNNARDQEFDRPVLPIGAIGGNAPILLRLDLVPQGLLDDAQVRRIVDDPALLWIDAHDALVRVGIAIFAHTVPDYPANIHFVVDDAGAALAIAGDRAIAPAAARGRADAILVQALGNRLGGPARGEFLEDTNDDSCFVRLYAALTANWLALGVELAHHFVAIAQARGDLAVLDPTALTPTDLGGELGQEHLVHHALEADLDHVHPAFGERVDFDAVKAHALVNIGGVALITADAVERLGEDDVELALLGVRDQRLQAWALHRSARNPVVSIDLGDRPALAVGVLTREADLIFDRGAALQIA